MCNGWNIPEPPLEPLPPSPLPRCPICGEETDTYYRNKDYGIVGCDMCVTTVDAYDD